MRASLTTKERQYAKAADDFAQVVKAQSPDSAAYRESAVLLGQSLYLSSRFKEAVPWLEKTAAAGPRKLEASYMLGFSFVQLRDTRKAAMAFAGLFGVAPDSAAAYLIAAQMMVRHGFEEDAEKAAARASSIPTFRRRTTCWARSRSSTVRSSVLWPS